jgi:hypothetical protein
MAAETVILDAIPFQPNLDALATSLRLRQGSRHADQLRELAGAAQAIARPKALFKAVFIEERGDDWIVLDGVRLTSRVLQVNLQSAYRVFPYVVTCGTEVDAWARAHTDMLQRFWADAICGDALHQASQYLQHELTRRYQTGQLSFMSPGCLQDWPIAQQRALFGLLGDTERAVGVRLSGSLLMSPVKSVSGIRFPAEVSFESCQLCPREDCPGRRAPYDAALYELKYCRPGLSQNLPEGHRDKHEQGAQRHL